MKKSNVFECPQCGQSNEYDPWTDRAQCQHCGFTPPEGQEMLDYLRLQDEVANTGSQEEPKGEPGPEHEQKSGDRTRLTRFLPTDGRSFLTGLAWGVLVFAVLMLFGSALTISGSVVRCLALLLPFLTTFAVWRWYAWREERS